MRTLKFTFITGDRFEKDPYNKIVSMDKQLRESLKNYPIKLEGLKIRELRWPGPTIQYRKTYYLQKLNRSITWNDIYGIINKTQAPYFQFV